MIKLLTHFRRFEAINKRILFICLRISGQNIIINNCHALTEEKDGVTKDAFYEKLQRAYESFSRLTIIIKIGDMNAKIGHEYLFRPAIGKKRLHSVSNNNGTRIINYVMSHDIIISGTYFQRKDIY